MLLSNARYLTHTKMCKYAIIPRGVGCALQNKTLTNERNVKQKFKNDFN